MLILQAIILGITQGLTEFLPVSSSAHLVIIPWLFGWMNPEITGLTFDVALHLGTLVAICIFFAKDIAQVASAGFMSVIERKIGNDQNRRLAWFIIFASVPGGFAGFLLENRVQTAFHVVPVASVTMIVMAIIIAVWGGFLWFVDAHSSHVKKLEKMTVKDSIIVGLSQALAIFPGVSRSGATITAGLALGFEREAAARFSFLLSAPIIAGAGLKSALDLHSSGGLSHTGATIFLAGFIAAGITGFLSINFLMRYLKTHSTRIFTWYRLALAVFVAVVALIRL